MNKVLSLELNKKFSLIIAAVAMTLIMSGMALAAEDNPARLFDDNSLIRGEDRKIFVIANGERRQIKDLNELRRDFRGKEIINVDDETLAAIRLRADNSGPGSVNSSRGPSANSGPGSVIRNNGLIRSQDRRIFVVENGERRQVRDLTELRREHAGQAIINVDDAALKRFPVALEDNPDRLFDDNRLLRNAQGRIFVVEDNSLRRIADLNELRREHLGQAIHNVNDDILLASGVKLRGDGTVDDDNSVVIRGLDDFVNGVKLRGDGTVDDNLPRHSGLDDVVAGVKLRGDGTVDDNSEVSGRNRGSDDSSSSSSDSGSGGDSGSSGRGGSGGGNSSDD